MHGDVYMSHLIWIVIEIKDKKVIEILRVQTREKALYHLNNIQSRYPTKNFDVIGRV